MKYPFSPGYKEDGASREAAQEIKPRVKSLRERVLRALHQGPGTWEDVAEKVMPNKDLLLAGQSIKPRLTELVRMGLAEKCGRAKSRFNNKNITIYRRKQD